MKPHFWRDRDSSADSLPPEPKLLSLADFLENRELIWDEESKPPVPQFVSEDGYDLCVRCQAKTSYETEIHVDYRIGYVEGIGQHCDMCWESIDLDDC